MPSRLHLIIVGATFAAGVAFGAWLVQSEPVPDGEMQTRDIGRTYTLDDWLSDRTDITDYGRVNRYEAPDSTDTRTECIQVPTWIQHKTNTDRPPSSSDDNGRAQTETATLPRNVLPSERLSADSIRITSNTISSTALWIGVPLSENRPAVNIHRDRVTLTGFLPSTGAVRQYTYALPEPPRFSVGIGAGAYIPLRGADPALHLPIRIRRRFDVGTRLGVTWSAAAELEAGLPVLDATPYLRPAALLSLRF